MEPRTPGAMLRIEKPACTISIESALGRRSSASSPAGHASLQRPWSPVQSTPERQCLPAGPRGASGGFIRNSH